MAVNEPRQGVGAGPAPTGDNVGVDVELDSTLAAEHKREGPL